MSTCVDASELYPVAPCLRSSSAQYIMMDMSLKHLQVMLTKEGTAGIVIRKSADSMKCDSHAIPGRVNLCFACVPWIHGRIQH